MCTVTIKLIASAIFSDRPNRFEPRLKKRRPKDYKPGKGGSHLPGKYHSREFSALKCDYLMADSFF